MYKQFITMTLALISLNIFTVQAQTNDEKKFHIAQISFIAPLGTQGIQSTQYVNGFSLNMLAGRSGGLKGLEIAGLINTTHGDIEGLQIAGLINHTKGMVTGMQLSGILNHTSEETSGLQISGLINNTGKNIKGVQMAGILNQCTDTLQGVQVSGLINRTRVVDGLQIGVINFADTVNEGLQLGFLNFAKNGYYALETGGNETMHGVVSWKMGTKKLYNIFSTGMRMIDKKVLWGLGYGLGTCIDLNAKNDISIDLLAYNMHEDMQWNERLNMLCKLNISYAWHITDKVACYAGASVNVVISENQDQQGHYVTEGISPWQLLKNSEGANSEAIYPGFHIGFRFQ